MLPTKFQFIWLRCFRGENLTYEKLTDDGRQVMAKANIAFDSLECFGSTNRHVIPLSRRE
jgi:hypothetical protein